MHPLRAFLLFPVRPGDAASVLRGRFAALPGCAAPPALLAAFLAISGCAPGDAGAAALALFGLILSLAIFGTAASAAASRIVGAPAGPKMLLGPCAAAAAWSPLLFLASGGFARLLFPAAAVPLVAGLCTLFWGLLAGATFFEGEEPTAPGRTAVASCTGMLGAIVGLLLAAGLLSGLLVLAAPSPPAPPDFHEFPGGVPLLLRPERTPREGDLLYLGGGPEGPPTLAVAARDGARALPDGRPVGLSTLRGRVFFRFDMGAVPRPFRPAHASSR